jgi:hypothetical protein
MAILTLYLTVYVPVCVIMHSGGSRTCELLKVDVPVHERICLQPAGVDLQASYSLLQDAQQGRCMSICSTSGNC